MPARDFDIQFFYAQNLDAVLKRNGEIYSLDDKLKRKSELKLVCETWKLNANLISWNARVKTVAATRICNAMLLKRATRTRFWEIESRTLLRNANVKRERKVRFWIAQVKQVFATREWNTFSTTWKRNTSLRVRRENIIGFCKAMLNQVFETRLKLNCVIKKGISGASKCQAKAFAK